MRDSLIQKLLTALFVVFAIIAAYKGFIYFSNKSKLAKIENQVKWVEDYYTKNGHYPTQELFNGEFSDSGVEEWYTAYKGDGKDEYPPQSFYLNYKLTNNFKKSYAIGRPERGFLGFEGKYRIEPCDRWRELGSGQPNPFIYVYPPGGLVFSNLNAGEVHFAHSEKLDEKIFLLKGVVKPRIFSKGNSKETQKIIITDGGDIISYDWDGAAIKLKNPQKIGEVPKGCPAS